MDDRRSATHRETQRLGDGSSHQFACEKHRDAILTKVTTAHRVLPLAEWLAGRGERGAQRRD